MKEKLRMRELTTNKRGLPEDIFAGVEDAQSLRVVMYPIEQQRGIVVGQLEVGYPYVYISPLYKRLYGFDLLEARVSSWKEQFELLDKELTKRVVRWFVSRAGKGNHIYG